MGCLLPFGAIVIHALPPLQVWVPSKFSQEVLVASGVRGDKIQIVPIPIDGKLFDPDAAVPLPLPMGDVVFGPGRQRGKGPGPPPPYLLSESEVLGTIHIPSALRKRPFVFLSTFKWENRKGWDRLLEAYLQV